MQSPAPQQPPVRQRILPQVFIPTAASVLALLAFSIAAPELATRWFTAAKTWAANDAGWFTMLAVAGFLIFVISLAFSRYASSSWARTTASPITAMPPGLPCCLPPAWASD